MEELPTRSNNKRELTRFMKDKKIDIFGSIDLKPVDEQDPLIKAKMKTRLGKKIPFLTLPQAIDLRGIDFDVQINFENEELLIHLENRKYELRALALRKYKRGFLFGKRGYKPVKRKLSKQLSMKDCTLKIEIDLTEAYYHYQQVEYTVKNRLLKQIDEDVQAILNGYENQKKPKWQFHFNNKYTFEKRLQVRQVEA